MRPPTRPWCCAASTLVAKYGRARDKDANLLPPLLDWGQHEDDQPKGISCMPRTITTEVAPQHAFAVAHYWQHPRTPSMPLLFFSGFPTQRKCVGSSNIHVNDTGALCLCSKHGARLCAYLPLWLRFREGDGHVLSARVERVAKQIGHGQLAMPMRNDLITKPSTQWAYRCNAPTPSVLGPV